MDAEVYMKNKYDLFSQLEQREYELRRKMAWRSSLMMSGSTVIGAGLGLVVTDVYLDSGLGGSGLITSSIGTLIAGYYLVSSIMIGKKLNKILDEKLSFTNQIMRELETELKVKEKV